MPHHEHVQVDGRITDVFFHRFVIELTSGGKILADVGPKGADVFPLTPGLRIIAEGDMKPSELKVERIARHGEAPVEIGHGKPHHHGPHHHGPHHHGSHHHHEPVDPDVARKAVTRAGLTPVGEVRRKPKHFEVLARKGVRLFEYHVELDGHIRKEKPVGPDDHKWADEIEAIA